MATLMLMTLAVIAAGGCGGGGGGGSAAKPSAYLYGELHGELASDLERTISFSTYDGSHADKMVVVSKRDGAFPIDPAVGEGLRESYGGGQVTAIEHATEDEVNKFLEVLELPRDFRLASPDEYVEIFAVQKTDAGNYRYVTMNDDGWYVTSGDVSADDLLSPDISENNNRLRTDNFIAWTQSAAARNALLKSETAAARSEAQVSADDKQNLLDLASSNMTTCDVSQDGETYLIYTTTYSCFSYNGQNEYEPQNTTSDFFTVKQWAQLNPAAKYYYKPGRLGVLPQPSVIKGWMRRYEFSSAWDDDTLLRNGLWPDSKYFDTVNSTPVGTNGKTTITSGLEFGIGGNVGFDGSGPTGGLSTNLSISSSQSVEVEDCALVNDCGHPYRHTAAWAYKFNDPITGKNHVWFCDVDAVPLSRSNFQPVNQWIWRSTYDFRAGPELTYFSTVFSRTYGTGHGPAGYYGAMFDQAKYEDWYTVARKLKTPMPLAPLIAADKGEIDFTSRGHSEPLTLISAKSWTLENKDANGDDVKWCEVTLESQPVTSGDATLDKSVVSSGYKGKVLHVETEGNDSGNSRSATLTFRAENGDKAVVKIYQSQYDN